MYYGGATTVHVAPIRQRRPNRLRPRGCNWGLDLLRGIDDPQSGIWRAKTRPPSILPNMSRNDPDRLVLSTMDDFVRDPADVEVFHL